MPVRKVNVARPGSRGLERGELGPDRVGGADRPQGVVLVDDRDAEDRHDRVADELLDGAAVRLDDPAA